jgi:hypothetical protein
METHNHLFDRVYAFENLLAAAREAQRGKRFEPTVGRFNVNLERELAQLETELRNRTYRPGRYTEMFIERPKHRMISAAPYRDRVVHHALCRVVMPLFERKWLMDTIIDGSNAQEPVCCVYPGDDLSEAAARRVGLPIGNLTSQWFGGVYLSDFDHWVKETLRCPGYVRYVDDFLLFAEAKTVLADWRAAIQTELAGVRLRLNERKSRVYRAADGVSFLGQRVWPGRRRLLSENVRAARRRLAWNVRQCRRGLLGRDALRRRWVSWRGHALHAGAQALVGRIERDVLGDFGATGTSGSGCCVAARGTTTRPTCGARTATTTGRAITTTTTASVV